MPEIEYAFLADGADARPGQKFAIIGGGVSRLGGSAFPLRHPHLALVVGLALEPAEIGQELDLRFSIVTPKGDEMATAQASITAGGPSDGRASILTFALDLWNLSFPMQGDYDIRIFVGSEERKRLSLIVELHRPERSTKPPSGPARVTPPFPPQTGNA